MRCQNLDADIAIKAEGHSKRKSFKFWNITNGKFNNKFGTEL